MGTPSKYVLLFIAILVGLVAIGALVTPSNIQAKSATLPTAAATPAASQDAGTPAPTAASAPKPVELPDGDGKTIATEYCQMCHKLTNITKAHKNLDDWKDTIQTMIERGASIPDDKIGTLAAYLAQNFGPESAGPSGSAGGAATAPAAAPPTSASASAAAKPVELPDGEGKQIATEDCQACHKLTNITKAHKSLDDWKDTVQTMIDRGANVPPEKVDTLVQYLAKNFGAKDAAAPGGGSATPAAPAQ